MSCVSGCGTCVVPLRTGNRCGSDVFVMSTPGRQRYIFTTCGAICPVMSATFSQVQDALGAERDAVRMVSISIVVMRSSFSLGYP